MTRGIAAAVVHLLSLPCRHVASAAGQTSTTTPARTAGVHYQRGDSFPPAPLSCPPLTRVERRHMATTDVNTSKDGQAADVPGTEIPGEGKSGRKPPAYYRREVMAILKGSAPYAAIVIDENIRANTRGTGKKRPVLPAGLAGICQFVIEQVVGKAKQKIEHSGAVLTYGEVSKSAENLAKKGRDILADAEAIKDGYAGSDGDSSPAATPAPAAPADPPASKLDDV